MSTRVLAFVRELQRRFAAERAGLYGTIGVVFALLVWMLVLGYLAVAVALAERVIWDQGARRSRDQEPSPACA